MHRTDYGRCVRAAPGGTRQLIRDLGVISQEMLYGTGNLSHWARRVKKVHFIIAVSDFVWNAACPRFDFVEAESFFVVPRFTNIDMLVSW